MRCRGIPVIWNGWWMKTRKQPLHSQYGCMKSWWLFISSHNTTYLQDTSPPRCGFEEDHPQSSSHHLLQSHYLSSSCLTISITSKPWLCNLSTCRPVLCFNISPTALTPSSPILFHVIAVYQRLPLILSKIPSTKSTSREELNSRALQILLIPSSPISLSEGNK